MDFSKKLQHLIDIKHKSNADFYNSFDCATESAMKGWLYNGKIPRNNIQIALCEYFDCDFEYLFGEQEELRKTDITIENRLGLSQESILNLNTFTEQQKIVLNLLFSNMSSTKTQKLLDIFFTSGIYLANGQNHIDIKVKVLPDTDESIIHSLNEHIDKSGEDKILKTWCYKYFDDLFDDITKNEFFYKNNQQYLYDRIMEAREQMEIDIEYMKKQNTNELPPLPKTN